MVTILELLYHGLDTGLTVRQQDAMVAPNDQMFFSVQLNLNRRSLFSRCLKQSQPSKSKCLGLLEHKTEQRRYTTSTPTAYSLEVVNVYLVIISIEPLPNIVRVAQAVV